MKFFLLILLSLSVSADEWTDKFIRGRTAPATAYKAELIYENFSCKGLVALYPFPKGEGLLAAGLGGKISLLKKDGSEHIIADFNYQKINLYSIAFDPSYPVKPYVYLAIGKDKVNRIFRYRIDLQKLQIVDDSKIEIISWETGGHNGCELRFGLKDGHLYLSTGDGGLPGDKNNVGQKVDNLLGSVLRLDVSETTHSNPYKIPTDNPFARMKNVRGEIWSYGLRNPWRMSFDPISGKLLIGDNGEASWEYVFLSHKGANHGWSVFEGSHPFKPTQKIGGPTKTVTNPVIERSHVDTRSIIGGYVYQGRKFPELKNHYLFADYVTGLVWAAAWDGKSAGENILLCNSGLRPICFGHNEEGDILLGGRRGKIWRLRKVQQNKDTLDYPERLSQTGIYESTKDDKLISSALNYKINSPSWKDGASSEKYVLLPDNGRISAAREKWEIPDGAVLVQTLKMKVKDKGKSITKRIETQTIHREGSIYNFRNYKWLDDQSDAVLVPVNGDHKELTLPNGEKYNWVFQSTNQCFTCHTSLQPSFTLAFNTSQLNVDGQIENLIKAKKLGGKINRELASLPSMVNYKDENIDLEKRARSYLHVNCAHCHQRGAIGGRAQFQLLYDLILEKTGLVNENPIVPLFSGPKGKLIYSGHPENSEIYQRLSRRGAGQMPLFGSSIEDKAGSRLIYEWIKNMEVKK